MKTAYFSRTIDQPWPEPVPHPLDGPRTLVLAFGPRALLEDPAPLQALAGAFPGSVLMGCSSAGEISAGAVGDNSLSVAVARFERTPLHRASTSLADAADSFAAGGRLARQLPRHDLRAVFLLSCGVGINGAALVRGLVEALPPEVSLSGGFAGDDSRFDRTWVLEDGGAREHRVTAVGLYGEALRVGHGCCGGWSEFGPERTVTRAEDNVLYELDGGPALALYKHYLGELASQLPGSALLFPLALLPTRPGGAALVRTVLAVDEQAQSMTFAGDIPVGAKVRLMRTSVDRLVSSAEDAARQAVGSMAAAAGGPDAGVLAVSVSCIGRRLVMGERVEEEVDVVREQLPAGAAHAGFYSYGEVAAAHGSPQAQLHNQTMTLTVFRET
jgi:hypothetical protein